MKKIIEYLKKNIDMVLHFLISALLVVVVAGVCLVTGLSKTMWNAQCSAFGVAITIGIAKEFYDGFHGKASLKDLAADLAGCMVGVLILFMF